MKYKYCKVCVRGATAESVVTLLGAVLDSTFEHGQAHLRGLVVEVRGRSSWDATEDSAPGDADFDRWPVSVELEAQTDASAAAMVETTSKILYALWDCGISAVASGDFDDELPWGGGGTGLLC